MAMGRCMECDKLVTILPGPQKWGSREVAWRPIHHDRPDELGGGPCDGHKKDIVSRNPREGLPDLG